ncbi:pyruvate dehydrogenase (acetyl-transferring) kinase, mitochondrial [Tanacetum coccineum]
MYVGEGEALLRNTFRRARLVAPSIIFFDDADVVSAKRGTGSSGSSTVGERNNQGITSFEQLDYGDEATEEKYERARMASFVGAMAIADLVKTTLGPKGMVSDEGGGIPRSGLPRIFTYLYSSAKNPLTERADLGTADIATMAGYGVGLPISRLYAQYFGGDLQIIPMEGYGSAFSCVFPEALKVSAVQHDPRCLTFESESEKRKLRSSSFSCLASVSSRQKHLSTSSLFLQSPLKGCLPLRRSNNSVHNDKKVAD